MFNRYTLILFLVFTFIGYLGYTDSLRDDLKVANDTFTIKSSDNLYAIEENKKLGNNIKNEPDKIYISECANLTLRELRTNP